MSPSHNESKFNILPHPARTNDPRDLEPPQLGAGLNSNPEQQAFHARGPYKPSQQVLQGVEQPRSREELKAQSAQLNNRQ
ncbi:uncharacterized protein C8Q71DRAFT_863706 [Rhodofomes roseus]|uniref:Uncharacterized protein n=1 Tax=Rhodofomes roseus TaxID=34475 RepID=A0ABQ8JY40_9APHY|nr:uncharacterized protein C8Q71DRAFT_863706 [Rhodofomes roseus]KAH9828767.1 hypothetical protein C8Q71DRAFT_863706 [Rhodofomes roseus]